MHDEDGLLSTLYMFKEKVQYVRSWKSPMPLDWLRKVIESDPWWMFQIAKGFFNLQGIFQFARDFGIIVTLKSWG